jgi:hypothetical protein
MYLWANLDRSAHFFIYQVGVEKSKYFCQLSYVKIFFIGGGKDDLMGVNA